MKVVILYRPNSEHGSAVEAFMHDYQQRNGQGRLEALSIDTRDGSAVASLYDVMQYPTIMVLQEDGRIQRSWEGGSLPLMDEVSAYARG